MNVSRPACFKLLAALTAGLFGLKCRLVVAAGGDVPAGAGWLESLVRGTHSGQAGLTASRWDAALVEWIGQWDPLILRLAHAGFETVVAVVVLALLARLAIGSRGAWPYLLIAGAMQFAVASAIPPELLETWHAPWLVALGYSAVMVVTLASLPRFRASGTLRAPVVAAFIVILFALWQCGAFESPGGASGDPGDPRGAAIRSYLRYGDLSALPAASHAEAVKMALDLSDPRVRRLLPFCARLPLPIGQWIETPSPYISIYASRDSDREPPSPVTLRLRDGGVIEPLRGSLPADHRWHRLNFRVPPSPFQIVVQDPLRAGPAIELAGGSRLASNVLALWPIVAGLAALSFAVVAIDLFRSNRTGARTLDWTMSGSGLTIAMAAFGVLAWRQYLLVDKFAVNLMYWDQWWYYQNLADHGTWLSSFLFQLGPHRMGVGLLVTRILANLGSWNSRWDAFAVSFTLILAAALAWKLARRCGVRNGAALAAVPLMFLNLHGYGALTETANLSHGAMPVLLIVLFALSSFVTRDGWRLFVQAVLAVLLIFTGFGIFMGIVALLIFSIEAAQSWRSRRQVKLAYAMSAVAVVVTAWVLFFRHYQFISSIPNFRFPYEKPHEYFLFIALMLANFFGVAHAGPLDVWVGAAVAAALLLAGGLHGWRMIRQGVVEQPTSTVIFSLATFEFIYLINTAIGRVMLGLDGAPRASRYVVLIVPGALAIFLTLANGKPARRSAFLALVFAILLVPATAFLHWSESQSIVDFATGRRIWKETYLETHSEARASARSHFDVFPIPIPDRLRYLEEHRLNLFHDASRR
jgi:hypothetical protein